MKLSSRSIILILFGLFQRDLIYAQDKNTVEMPIVFSIPTIALVDFAGSDKHISFIPGKGAEQIITPSTLDKTWINYSFIVEGKSTNSISVQISSGTLPAEIRIKLDVGEDVGAGAGTMGKPVGQITLSPYPREIITGIGNCYTGKGIQKGHQLIYSWEWMPPYDIDHSSIDKIEIAVIYTLTNSK